MPVVASEGCWDGHLPLHPAELNQLLGQFHLVLSLAGLPEKVLSKIRAVLSTVTPFSSLPSMGDFILPVGWPYQMLSSCNMKSWRKLFPLVSSCTVNTGATQPRSLKELFIKES